MDLLSFYKDFSEERERLTNKDSKVLIIDGLNRFISVWSAVPALNYNGEHIGGIAGFLKSIGFIIRHTDCTRCIIVFDGPGGSARRKKIFPDYKHRRTPKQLNRTEFSNIEEEKFSMRRQMARILEYLEVLPITVMQIDNIEADDAIANLITSQYENENNSIVIASSDKDFLQLVNDKVSVYNPIAKKTFTPNDIEQEFGIKHENYLIYRVFTGDSSDNIPGVKGLGLKTLTKEFRLNEAVLGIDDIINTSREKKEEKSPKKIFSKIINDEYKINLNYRLMQLNTSDISLYSKNEIRDYLKSSIPKSDRYKFKKMFYEDHLQPSFKDIDKWLRDTFDTLDYWSDK